MSVTEVREAGSALAVELLDLVNAEPDTRYYAEITRVVSLGIPLAEVIKHGLATATPHGVDILRESVHKVRHYAAFGVWCGAEWGCKACGREPGVVEHD